MPRKRESLGEEIRHVNAARDVSDKELQLSHAVPKPVKPHVARLRELRLDGPIGKAYCDFIVAVDHRGALGIAKVVQDLSLAGRDLCSAKGAGVFRFLDGGTNDRDAGGVDRDGRVDKARVPETTEMVEGTGDAAGVGSREVGGVREHAKLHLGREEHLPAITVGRHEPEQAFQRSHGRKGSLGLGAGEGAGGGEHSPIDAPPVIQEVADGDLELLLLS